MTNALYYYIIISLFTWSLLKLEFFIYILTAADCLLRSFVHFFMEEFFILIWIALYICSYLLFFPSVVNYLPCLLIIIIIIPLLRTFFVLLERQEGRKGNADVRERHRRTAAHTRPDGVVLPWPGGAAPDWGLHLRLRYTSWPGTSPQSFSYGTMLQPLSNTGQGCLLIFT